MKLIIKPRETVTWDEFCANAPPKSIALDGYVSGGPAWNESLLMANFDHHSGVVREATMSTAMQVMFAIKGGLIRRLGEGASFWVNDPDQDTSFATWLLRNHHLFDGVQSHPQINRLLSLNDRLDITGGAYPMRLDDKLVEMHAWVFEPYSELRISGALASADEAVMRNCIEAVHGRLNKVLLGEPGFRAIQTAPRILYNSSFGYKVLDETEGGNESRYVMFAQGMDAFVSLVARRPDGRFVYSIGRRSRYIDFPLPYLYSRLNGADDVAFGDMWGGSDIVGGSPRQRGSSLSWERIHSVLDDILEGRDRR